MNTARKKANEEKIRSRRINLQNNQKQQQHLQWAKYNWTHYCLGPALLSHTHDVLLYIIFAVLSSSFVSTLAQIFFHSLLFIQNIVFLSCIHSSIALCLITFAVRKIFLFLFCVCVDSLAQSSFPMCFFFFFPFVFSLSPASCIIITCFFCHNFFKKNTIR